MSGFNFITPEEYRERALAQGLEPAPLAVLKRRAARNQACQNCGAHAWRLVNIGLCFTCTTGESDASDDYEIGEPYDE